MKSTGRWLVRLSGPVVMVLGGCAAPMQELQTEALLPEIDVVQVKENSDEALKIAQETRMEVEAIHTRISELDNRLMLLSEEIAGISSAKIEELENRMALIIEAYKDLQAQISSIEVLPQVRVVKKQAAPPTFSPADGASLLKTSSEYEAYHAALRVYNARNYKKAVEQFTAVLESFPKGTYNDNCLFWIGESHYALADYASAVASFTKVLEFPSTSKADDAQLKLGVSYLKMGQYGVAKGELQKLIDRYPASEYVPRARKLIAEMQ